MDSWRAWKASVEGIPDMTPSTFDKDLAPKEQEAMAEMHRRHCKDAQSLHKYIQDPTFRHTVFRRFLGARAWNIDRADRLLARALVWRTKNNIDDLSFLPSPDGFARGYDLDPDNKLYDRRPREDERTDRFLMELQKSYHGTWHKWDRDGNPVFIERTGHSNPRGMVRTAKEFAALDTPPTTFDQKILHGHLLSMELGCHLTKLQTVKLGRPIFQFTYILDLKGYKLSHIHQPIFQALKLIIENDKRYYPETTCHALVVNAPGIVSLAYDILCPLLDKRTREKVQILGGNYKPILEKIVDPKDIPTFLGGQCECPGGCVP